MLSSRLSYRRKAGYRGVVHLASAPLTIAACCTVLLIATLALPTRHWNARGQALYRSLLVLGVVPAIYCIAGCVRAL